MTLTREEKRLRNAERRRRRSIAKRFPHAESCNMVEPLMRVWGCECGATEARQAARIDSDASSTPDTRNPPSEPPVAPGNAS